jgi:hypothetical protein
MVFEAGAAAGAAAGALEAGFAAGAAIVFDAAGVLESALASAFLLFRDFFEVVAEESLAAILSPDAVLSSAAAASLSFLLFLDFFLVVVALLSVVVVELVWAAANTGIKARLNTKDKIAVHRVNLFRELLISLFPHM